jgi:hypothetical protein
MANFTATDLLTIRVQAEASMAARINKNELRPPLTGALNAYFASTPDLINGGASTISSLKNSTAQPVAIPVVKQLTTTVDSARACGATEVGDSALITPTFQIVSKGFKMSSLMFAGNEINFQEAFRNNLEQTFIKLHLNLEQKAITNLVANQSAINNGSLNTWFGALNQMNVSAANYNYFYSSIAAELLENNFNGQLFNVHMAAGREQVLRTGAQGMGNATNLQWQMDGFTHFATNSISRPTASTTASFIFVPGTVGIVPWINKVSRIGEDFGTEMWTTINDPFVPGLTWELKVRKSCADNSAVTTGGEADPTYEFRISAEFAYIAAYTSNTDTGIYKYVQKNI